MLRETFRSDTTSKKNLNALWIRTKKISRKDALTEVDRVIIENEKVKGSISLKGAIFDDLSFKNYKKDLKSEENVENIELFNAHMYSWKSVKKLNSLNE